MARILLAEDEPHILRILSMWLQRSGHSVTETSDGVAALEALDLESVDLIISDMNMPRLDGRGLVQAVRDQRGLTMPFLMLSARCDQSELGEEMKAYGVRLYPKPFVPSRLVAEIGRLLAVTTSVSRPRGTDTWPD